jgi:hypothetical protein
MDDIEIVPNNFTNIGRFSNRPIITDDQSFQTNSMIHKIKKVKNKKMANYKNIELLEDIHEIPENNSSNKQTVREGLSGLMDFPLPHPHDNYTGYDDINDNGNSSFEDPRDLLVDSINYFYNIINDMEYRIAYEITKLISGNEFHEEDVNAVKGYIEWFLTVIISIYVTFNWYFLLFYIDTDSLVKVANPFFDIETITKKADSNVLYGILFFLLKYSLIILNLFDSFFTKNIYEWTGIKTLIEKYTIFRAVLFILTFYFTIYFLYNSIGFIKNTMINIIHFDINTWYIPLLMIFSGFFIFKDIIKKFIEYMDPLSKSLVFDFLFVVCSLLFFILFIFITPVISALFILIYFIIYSFFGIYFYSKFDTDKANIIMKKIMDSCSNERNIQSETFCKKLGIFDKIKNYFMMFFEFWYTYLFHSAFLFMFLYNSANCLKQGVIKSVTLKSVLHAINFSLVFVILIYTIIDYNRKNRDKQEEKEVCVKDDTCIVNNELKNGSEEKIQIEPEITEEDLNEAEHILETEQIIPDTEMRKGFYRHELDSNENSLPEITEEELNKAEDILETQPIIPDKDLRQDYFRHELKSNKN